MMKFFSKMIKSKIKHLETEQDLLRERKELLPQGTLAYESCVLVIAVWGMKIAILRALIGKEVVAER